MKAILVLEMPSSCDECICKFATISGKMICRYTKKELKPKRDKPSWCPLKPMPEKKRKGGTKDILEIFYNIGYNACVDEILGDKE